MNKNIEIIDNITFQDFSKHIDADTGFLHVNGVVSRTGLQSYYGMELGDKENPSKLFNIYRPKEEVLKDESLKTFINAPLTDNHPESFVTVDNVKDLIKGSLSEIETYSKDGIDYVKAKMVVHDKTLINKIMSGKVELSAGYRQDLIKEKGEFQGEQYDYKQTNIKVNHVSFVDKGRCGDKCKITADNKAIIKSKNKNERDSMIKYKINDAEVEICDTVFAHINDLKKSLKDAEAEVVEATKKADMLEGEKAKLEEDMEEEKKNKTSDADIAQLINDGVNEKVALIDTAKELKVTVDSKLSPIEIKKAVIASNSKISLDGKSNEFIDGVYETVIASTIGKAKNIEDSHKKAFDGFVPTTPTTTNDAYNKYVENLKNKHKGDK